MQSKEANYLGRNNEKYKIMPVSKNHLIIWVFFVEDKLNPQQKKQINLMYGVTKNTFTPITKTYQQFQATMQSIKTNNQNCIVNVVVSQQHSYCALQIATQYQKIAQVFIYLPNQKISDQNQKQQKYQDDKLKIVQKSQQCNIFNDYQILFNLIEKRQKKQAQEYFQKYYPTRNMSDKSKIIEKIKGSINNLNECIQLAKKQVHFFTKNGKIFNNSKLLIQNYEQPINLYRYRLIACIKIKISDIIDYFQEFLKIANQQFIQRNKFNYKNKKQKNISNSYSLNIFFIQYEKDVKEMLKQVTKQKYNIENFHHKIISHYQKEGFFYQLINNYLRNISKKQDQWEKLAVPYSNIYNAIKQLFKLGVRKEKENPQNKQLFYSGEKFTVWRGGKINAQELKQYEKYKSEKIFIEFYGFISTSLNLRIVVNKFLNLQKDDQENQNNQNQCLFKITCKNNKKILQDKYDFLLHGYYKFGKQQKHGDCEQQVLFNAMNIFQLKQVKKMKISKILQQNNQGQMLPNIKQMSNMKYNEQIYDKDIYLIELEYGPFFNVLFQSNIDKLSPYEERVRANYRFCMNKIRNCEQYDFADANLLVNDLKRAKKYLLKKTKCQQKLLPNSQQKNAKTDQLDKKNYFQQLFEIQEKQGKRKNAIHLAQLSIKWYKMLHKMQKNENLSKNYDKLYKMQTRIIQIYTSYQNFIGIQEILKDQLQNVKDQTFNIPQAKLRQSYIYLNMAINQFSQGKIKQSIDKFKLCKQQLKNVLQIMNIQQKCIFIGYLKNLFSFQSNKKLCYHQFQQFRKEQKIKEIQKQCGGKKQIQRNQKMASDLMNFAIQSLKQMGKIYKNQSQFKIKFDKFCKQIENLNQKQTQEPDDQTKSPLYNEIRIKISKIKRLQITSDKYKQQKEIIERKYKQLKQINYLNLDNKENDYDFIQQFLKSQTKRKIKFFNQNHQKMKTIKKKIIIDECTIFIRESQNLIQKLKKQGFSQAATKIFQIRKDIANTAFKTNNYKKAMQELNSIIENNANNGQHNKEFGKCYLMCGKIYLQQYKLTEAIQKLQQSILFFQKYQNHQSSIIQQGKMPLTNKKICYELIQSRMLLCKAKIYQIDLIQHNAIRSNIQQTEESLSWNILNQIKIILQTNQKQFTEAEKQVIQIQQIIADKLEIQANYWLRKQNYHFNLQFILDRFTQSIKLRKEIFGAQNIGNVLLCAELIIHFHSNQKIMNKIIKEKWFQVRKQFYDYYQHQNYFWKLAISKYYMEMKKKINQQNTINYLNQAIQNIQKIVGFQQYKKQNYLKKQLQKWQNQYQINFVQFNQTLQDINIQEAKKKQLDKQFSNSSLQKLIGGRLQKQQNHGHTIIAVQPLKNKIYRASKFAMQQ